MLRPVTTTFAGIRNTGRLLDLRGSSAILLILLSLTLVRGILYAILNPPFSSPDESAHFQYVTFLASQDQSGDPGAEKHQPPLYYALMVPAYLVSGGDALSRLMLVRIASISFALGIVALTWLSARRVAPQGWFVPTTATVLIALHPQLAYIGSSVNNDNAANFFAALLTYAMIRLITRPAGVVGIVTTVAAMGTALLTKGQVLPVVLVSGAVILCVIMGHAWNRRGLPALMGVTAGLAFGALVLGPLGASYLLARVETVLTVLGPFPQVIDTIRQTGFSPFSYQFTTFWSAFLGETLHPPIVAYLGPAALTASGFFGYLAGSREFSRRWGALPKREGFTLIALAATALSVWLVVYLNYIRVNSPGYQGDPWILQTISGRYLMPALVPIALLASIGWSRLLAPARHVSFVILFALLLAGLDVSSLATLATVHAWRAF